MLYNTNMQLDTSANRLRPRAFSELAGQDFVVKTLIGSLSSGRAAHAYLFSGPRGVGKTSAARLLALALNRPAGSDISQLDYPGSEDIRHGKSLDVVEIDGASYTSVENIRGIREELMYKPVQFAYKVYIIDEVHMLSNSAFNALLKTIEEPPEYAIFIFATTELHKVPATIRSRCQQFAFKRIGIQDIEARLSALAAERGIKADADALAWIAKEADGSLRDAYMLLDQVLSFNFEKITLAALKKHLGLAGLDALNELFAHCVRGEKKAALECAAALFEHGVSAEQFIFEAAEYVRNILFIKNSIGSSALMGYAPAQFDAAVYEQLSVEHIEKALELTLQCYRNIRYTANPRFEVELTVATLASLASYVSPAQLVERLEALRSNRESAQKFSGQASAQSTKLSAQQPPSRAAQKTPAAASSRLAADTRDENAARKNSTAAPTVAQNTAGENISASPEDDARRDALLAQAYKHDERLGVALESAAVRFADGEIVFSFKEKFALSVFEQHAQFVQTAAAEVYAETYSDGQKRPAVRGVLVEAAAAKPRPSLQLDAQENAKNTQEDETAAEDHSPAVQRILTMFGGSVRNDE